MPKDIRRKSPGFKGSKSGGVKHASAERAQRMCHGKVRREKKQARKTAKEYRDGKLITKNGWSMDSYKCRNCNYWHIGHNPKKYSRSRSKPNQSTEGIEE